MVETTLPMPTPVVPNKPLTSYKSLSFDIYGTLVDWETSIVQQVGPLLRRAPSGKHTDSEVNARATLVDLFHKHEYALQKEFPDMMYDQLLAEAYMRMASDLGVPADDETKKEAKRFGGSVGEWIAFPDTVDAMKRLGKYYKLVPLSNVDKESFGRTNAGPLNGVKFWRVYTAQDIGSYKPDLRNFQYMFKHLDEDDKSEGGSGISKDQDLHVAQSLTHDHKPAYKVGLASVWINRKGAMVGSEKLHEEGGIGYGWRYSTLGEFADDVERQWAAAK